MMTKIDDYAVLIVAAGCSRRMKKFKPLLPLGDSCVLQSTIESFGNAGLSDITVVVGYKRHKLIPLLRNLNVRYVENKEYDETDMLESIKLGIAAINPSVKGVLLCPGDVPLIAHETIVQVIDAYERHRPMLLIPTYHGEPGHPPIFSQKISAEILQHQGEAGLRGVFKQFEKDTYFLEVDDEEILQDTDLPEDYERLLRAYELRKKVKMDDISK